MTPTQKLYDFIKQFEDYSNLAYDDSLGVWTIGWGTIMYPDGIKVKKGDQCTIEEAEKYLEWEVNEKSVAVNRLLKPKIYTQNKFEALVSFAYNLGTGALRDSTLLHKANIHPMDETIFNYKVDEKHNPIADTCEFLKWVRGNGKIMRGLVRRRAAEADYYKS